MAKANPEPLPTDEELKRALPDLFYVASHCTAYHRAFAGVFPEAAATGAEIKPSGEMQRAFNAITEANLMFIRKSAEFFKPRKNGDKRDSLYSYLYPGYTRQGWIVPEETYEEFHKRVGHITVAEARQGKVAWPIFELSMQAMNQWADFFAAMASAYAADADTAALCARYAEAVRNDAADLERAVLCPAARRFPPARPQGGVEKADLVCAGCCGHFLLGEHR
ncbi:MAG: hypothetical protein HYV75_03560 [Opitutae bacterium]|nr:hypothetical protein [Opitutae bacterium]